MTKAGEMNETIDELSVGACERLAAGRGSRIGAVIEAGAYADELAEAGLIGEGGGLTIRGSAVAERLQRQYLDAMFS